MVFVSSVVWSLCVCVSLSLSSNTVDSFLQLCSDFVPHCDIRFFALFGFLLPRLCVTLSRSAAKTLSLRRLRQAADTAKLLKSKGRQLTLRVSFPLFFNTDKPTAAYTHLETPRHALATRDCTLTALFRNQAFT